MDKLIEKINLLEKENEVLQQQFLESLKQQLVLQEKIRNLEQQVNSSNNLLTQVVNVVKGLQLELEKKIGVVSFKNDIRNKNLPFELGMETEGFFYPEIEEIEATIEKVKSGKSLVRFGDGEFSLMFGEERPDFQHCNDELKHRLREIILSEEENILIGIADNYGSLLNYSTWAADDIRAYMTREIRSQHLSVLKKDRIYENAYISRPYVLYGDKDTSNPKKRFEALQTIWEGKHIVILEGEKTRLGIGNDLFGNVKSIERVICPAENAFSKYNEILEYIMTQDKSKMYLLALGPTATVLGYDMAKAGFWAIDVGHVDLEYEWFLQKADKPSEVKGKYNNEFPNGNIVEDIENVDYKQQIIKIII